VATLFSWSDVSELKDSGLKNIKQYLTLKVNI